MLFPALATLLLAQDFSGNGVVTVKDLCAQLTKSTGEAHAYDAIFSDHAIYFRLNSASPDRLRDLTAACLRGEWSHKANRWRLQSGKPPVMPDWFPAAWKKAYDPDGKSTETVPSAKVLYSMRVGDQFPVDGKLIRRLLGSIYEYGQTQWQVNGDLGPVTEWLGPQKDTVVKIPESIKPQPRMGGSSLSASPLKWSKTGPDPIYQRTGELMGAITKAFTGEVALPMPDDMAVAGFFFENDMPVEKALTSLTQWLEFRVEAGVLVGQLSPATAGAGTQANHTLVIARMDPIPEVIDTPVLSRFESEQPPLAAQAANDIMALLLGGAIIDATPHYPWDMRLYRSLSNADWDAMRQSGATVGDLSPAARMAINSLATKSRMVFEQYVATVEGKVPLETSVSLVESSDDPVIVYYSDRPPELMDLLNVAAHRDWRGYDDRQAKFLPIHRRLLTVVLGGQFKVPFTKVELPANRTPLRYSALPQTMRSEVEKIQQETREQRKQRVPPPVF